MRIVSVDLVRDAVEQLCLEACVRLPVDVRERLQECREDEPFPRAKDILDKLIENYTLAEKKNLPICQDTGMACVFLDIGRNVFLEGNIEEAVHEGVRRGYEKGFLRKSVVGDPLRRVNTKDNTPAMIYYNFVDGDRLHITLAPKGFGSENMSQIKMLKPSDGEEGVKSFVLEVVEQAGPNPCPPIVVGVGIGGTFDKAALLAKQALLRDFDKQNKDEYYAQMEQELLQRINEKGIGPQGLGGKTTALSVSILTAPTHIAGLPVAVNINCHVSRHKSVVI